MKTPKTPYQLFGNEVGVGWHALVQPLIERCKTEGVEIFQIKEKFGTLRFYVDTASDELHDAIAAAEKQSAHTCEHCGEPGRLRDGNWLRTLCDAHAKTKQNHG
jgi:hypothetical protein